MGCIARQVGVANEVIPEPCRHLPQCTDVPVRYLVQKPRRDQRQRDGSKHDIVACTVSMETTAEEAE